jgi:hypothetical protein
VLQEITQLCVNLPSLLRDITAGAYPRKHVNSPLRPGARGPRAIPFVEVLVKLPLGVFQGQFGSFVFGTLWRHKTTFEGSAFAGPERFHLNMFYDDFMNSLQPLVRMPIEPSASLAQSTQLFARSHSSGLLLLRQQGRRDCLMSEAHKSGLFSANIALDPRQQQQQHRRG